jgi:hypothetical protein
MSRRSREAGQGDERDDGEPGPGRDQRAARERQHGAPVKQAAAAASV